VILAVLNALVSTFSIVPEPTVPCPQRLDLDNSVAVGHHRKGKQAATGMFRFITPCWPHTISTSVKVAAPSLAPGRGVKFVRPSGAVAVNLPTPANGVDPAAARNHPVKRKCVVALWGRVVRSVLGMNRRARTMSNTR
jgi:hypothetical protein